MLSRTFIRISGTQENASYIGIASQHRGGPVAVVAPIPKKPAPTTPSANEPRGQPSIHAAHPLGDDIELWDGSRVPSTDGGGPTFRARSKDAIAYAVSAPGQLGLGRAYVSGAIEVDDLDAVIGLLNHWQPPEVGTAAKAR